MGVDIQQLINISKKAGAEIMKIYSQDFDVEIKDDNSPLTQADLASNKVINADLQKLYPDIPIISEENKSIPYEQRKDYDTYWLIDPLDGTKEFIKRNGEFTVNIALIQGGNPVLGVIYRPTQNITYYGIQDEGSYKIDNNGNIQPIRVSKPDKVLNIVGSRSHMGDIMQDFLSKYENDYEIKYLSAGSSLKFCLVAEGVAHIYPRLAPTMERDTAAGHIIATAAGAKLYVFEQDYELQYNKQDLLNPFFVVSSLD